MEKYHPSVNRKFNNLGISQGLKFRILMETLLPISIKLNFTPNNYFGLLWVKTDMTTSESPCHGNMTDIKKDRSG